MLLSLTIKNVVLIESLTVDFTDGFCALTGETGAGKSILLDSLGLALGRRAETGLVRKGADQAQVTASFDIAAGHPVYKILAEAGMDAETGDMLILKRTVGADGRSRAFINDEPVSVGLLRQAGDLLVEIHGQFDTHGLLDPKTHRALLDGYAGIDLSVPEKLYRSWRQAEKDCAAEKERMDSARREEEYLRQAVEDLDALTPEDGEEERLMSLRERLMKREQILQGLNEAYGIMPEIESLIGTSWRALDRAGNETAALREGLDRAAAEIQEVVSGLQSLSAEIEESEYALEDIDDRLFALRGQARKHQVGVDDLPRLRDELAGRLERIARQDEILADLMRQVEKAREDYITAAKAVRVAREKAAAGLDSKVTAELPPLKLDKARFTTVVEKLDDESDWGPSGMDRVSFMVATNPGSAPGALSKIASGGEMARFMLALKVVMAAVGTAGTLVFDEVDSGIGGSTAAAVGERLARLAAHRQIMVVTHAPQVAARADCHWIVSKSGRDTITTMIVPLHDIADRREEIARMLAGAEITQEARAAAQKLLEAA